MSNKKYHFYPKNTAFLESDVNKTFDEVVRMNDDQFRSWVVDVRKTIVDIWDSTGTPPVNGYSEEEILDQFNNLHGHPVHKMFVKDELTGDTCIRNTHNKLGNACNSWFPTMMKTRINYGSGEARSIYDYMARDDLLDRYMPYGFRHFKRDSFYAYSRCVKSGDALPSLPKIVPSDAVDYIEKFVELETAYDAYDFWINEKSIEKNKEYTGYNEDLIGTQFYTLTYEQFQKFVNDGKIKPEHMTNVRQSSDEYCYEIRMYKKGQKIFPVGMKSFRISVCQYAVNFPPLIAKALWEKYTEEFKDDDEVYIWDPSSGWGGRLLGSLSCKGDRQIKYLGCDPNTDHTISELDDFGVDEDFMATKTGTKTPYTKYDDLACFYTNETNRNRGIFPHANKWKVWQLGSEEMQHDQEFQQYKGKVSTVFTSPPYFHREMYSEDDTQSCHKFEAYEDWRDTFLTDTLTTAYEWLRPGGYILWNIADIKEGSTFVPLEQDSCDIMEKLGFEKVEVLKLVLGQMPGGNRTSVDSNGEVVSTNKNSVRIDGRYYRYEPIFCYRKPKESEK